MESQRRGDSGASSIFKSKRAQVTLFIIVGIILLFVFLAVMFLASSVTKQGLLREEGNVYGSLVSKEAMRIAIKDCLDDDLEQGLHLLGRQGTFWVGDPGGRGEFEDQKNGIRYGGDKVLYGIVAEGDNYPCSADEECVYTFPDTQVGFGETTRLNKRTLQANLKRYVKDQTTRCISKFAHEEISGDIELGDINLNIAVNLESEGIAIKAEFPLEFSLLGEEYFQFSSFDFFYETQFSRFVQAAVLEPLQADWRYVDFDYDGFDLKRNNFRYASSNDQGYNCVAAEDERVSYNCETTLLGSIYEELDVWLRVVKVGEELQDDVFIFSTNIKPLGEYEFRIARQNRAPALDYVGKNACLKSFDYLVVPNELGDDKDIDIELYARDPDDGDGIEYLFEPVENFPKVDVKVENERGQFVIENVDGRFSRNEPYILKAISRDEHGAKDTQDIRVLIDNPLELSVELDMDYKIMVGGELVPYADFFPRPDGRYFVSKEDPLTLRVRFAGDSVHKLEEESQITLSYEDEFEFNPQELKSEDGIIEFTLPWFKQGGFDWYNQEVGGEELIEVWENILVDPQQQRVPEQELEERVFTQVGEEGVLQLDFSAGYCSGTTYEDSTQKNIEVVGCIPHVSESSPYPYIPGKNYHQYVFELDDEGKRVEGKYEIEDANPFLATHICCESDWTVSNEGEECFRSLEPERSCNGDASELANLISGDYQRQDAAGYLVEERVEIYFCDGERGNICGSKRVDADSVLVDEEHCANPVEDGKSCSNVALVECAGEQRWSLGEDYWCAGPLGCGFEGEACTVIVAKDFNYDMNNLPENPRGERFVCGCNSNTIDKPCLDLSNKQVDTFCIKDVEDYVCA
jgi:hypothetical protein